MLAERIKIKAIAPTQAQDREIQPHSKCLCCHDSGLVANEFLSEFVEGENAIQFICKRWDCESGKKYLAAYEMPDEARTAYAKKHGGEAMPQSVYRANFDNRLTSEDCEEIHNMALKRWGKELKNARERSQELQSAIANIGNFQLEN